MRHSRNKISACFNFDRKGIFYSFIFILLTFITASTACAETISDIQAKIKARNADIKSLEREIAGYQTQLTVLGDQADSLRATLKLLDLNRKKLQADIQITENKIAAKNLTIQELGGQISDKEETIADDRRVVNHSLILIAESGDKSVEKIILSADSLSGFWNTLDQLGLVQNGLVQRIKDLRQVKADLEMNKIATEKAKNDLISLNNQLKNQRQVVLGNQMEKNQLLQDTKQSELKYQQILAEKQIQKDAFEKEVLDYESQLKITVDVSKLPRTGSGILSWPVDKVFITQYFGNTPFATANSQVYGGKGHNGVDLRAAIGTPIKAALSGVVVGIGDTDLVRGCYSYGKWVMIRHQNGLSTLYAHLSLQTVSEGDSISTSQIIGYSGSTGYTTGPHLHFGVYATQGVQIAKLFPSQSVHCTGVLIPLADFKAYLNPLSYL